MNTRPCPDCDGGGHFNRREFLKTTMATVATAAALPMTGALRAEPPVRSPSSETLVKTLYQTLTDAQRKVVCFPFDHPLRSKVDNNWMITDKKIAELFTKDQQAMIRAIFAGLHSPEYAETVFKQVEHDSGNEGFGRSSIALFGQPGTGRFEFVITGRHCTRRCDGDSVEGAAFGGPIFYGHAAHSFYEKADHRDNAYWFQALRANEVFKALDGRQRKLALLEQGREEKGTDTVKLTGRKEGLPGIPLTELSSDQKELVRKVLGDLLAPFRKADADEAMKLIEAAGFEHLHMAFYKKQDIGEDGVWDVWQVEGPSMVWYFRGEPHVHVWANIRRSA